MTNLKFDEQTGRFTDESILAIEKEGSGFEDYAKESKMEPAHDDECDCIKCLARREPGGLEYDPSNDDDEFEEHERQVFRDAGIAEEEK